MCLRDDFTGILRRCRAVGTSLARGIAFWTEDMSALTDRNARRVWWGLDSVTWFILDGAISLLTFAIFVRYDSIGTRDAFLPCRTITSGHRRLSLIVDVIATNPSGRTWRIALFRRSTASCGGSDRMPIALLIDVTAAVSLMRIETGLLRIGTGINT